MPKRASDTAADRSVPVAFALTARSTPCFTLGTLVTTQRGECPVESLTVNDRVVTRDNGLQAVRWLGRTEFVAFDFQVDPHLMPVMIRKGALADGLPERDMMVSPNHRVLVENERSSLRFRDPEVLVAAKHLSAKGVKTVHASAATYVHFMCDQHEIVLADGIWTETFQPEDQSLKGIGNAQRLEIFEIFPDLQTAAGREAYGAARATASLSDLREPAR